MKLNCRPGDIAVTKGTTRNAGKLVRCVRFIGTHHWPTQEPAIDHDVWEVDSLGQTLYERSGRGWCGSVLIQDRHLTPIRGGDGEDEMLRMAGLPPECAAL